MNKTKVILPEEIIQINEVEDKLNLLENIKRTFNIFKIDCGSCNGCEIEIFAAIEPMLNFKKFGFKLVENPRHSDVLLCSGPVTRQMYYSLLRAYEATSNPKVVVAVGACGCSGGIFYGSYAIRGGIDSTIPVDVFIPGCPPHPASIIYGLFVGLGVLEQELKQKEHNFDNGKAPEIPDSILGTILFERDVFVEAKRLMGYLFGKKLYEKFLNIIKESKNPYDYEATKKIFANELLKEKDSRYKECMITLFNDIYLKYIKQPQKT